MNNRIQIAFSQFDNGFNCAQSVVYSFCDEVNLDKEIALKISSGFGGGMGRMEEVCGAVTGGIMVIGAKYGRDSLADNESTEITYSKTQELMNTFTKNHGTYICRKLIKDCDLTTEDGQKNFKELDLKNKVCKSCIASVIENLEEII